MENIIDTVKEKMKKTYSFTGKQLVITGLGVVILLSIFATAGRHGWPRSMMDNSIWWRQQIMKHKNWNYNKRNINDDQSEWIEDKTMIKSNTQEQPESMVNNTQAPNIQENQNQPNPLWDATGSGN